MDLELTDRVAVVTGASKGIGLATVRTLLDEGARVVAVSRSRTSELEDLASKELTHVTADLTEPDAPARAIAAAAEAYGGVDVVVNNAGGPPPGAKLPRFTFMSLTDDDWREMFEFNLLSAVRAARAAIPLMLERGGGAIVNVSTVNARQPGAMNFDYAATKAGLSNLTMSLSDAYASQGIRVNTVSPGPVRTPWWTDDGGAADIIAAQAGASREEVLDSVAPSMMNLATGRLVSAQEVADAIVWVASPRSASTIGSDVVVDGGLLKTV
ncbi:SDR family NAD(P)-dependent oxidoreductase [Solicola gregarius]|uniref:SDR family NAD(P)-dependent oxidoreductase n=1 Tax=Solicola gregarius TaxID=2908642 RepID=A0AA46TI97_9ACTN|nr:SDR family NAD(P)-dependent oxidoreductase [Solicola gregarius]UYM05645.1 SDR family NAD(P)-dependent oxidoreductase [Solicola gregarius]